MDWNWSDGGSGLDPANCTTSSASSGEGSAITLSATCKDQAGNQGSASYTVKVDKTRPTAVAAALTPPNASGWYNANVTVRFTCADALSGVVSCPADQTLSAEGSAVGSTAQTVTDQAGNRSVPSNVVTVKIDKTAPGIALASRLPAANGAGWNNASVTVAWNCTDAGSGVLNATVSRTLSGEGANQSALGACADNAGNSSSNTQNGISIDKTAPALSPVVSPNPVLRYLSATATPNATDALSGVQSSSCAAVSTSSLGNFAVVCTAADRAGNAGSGSASYAVISASTALNSLASQVQGISNLSRVNQTLLLATLTGTRTLLHLGLRAEGVRSMNAFILQVNRLRTLSGGLTSAQADGLIAQANLIIQSINAGN